MLADWLSPRALPDFLDGDLGKRPCAGARTALDTMPLLTWETFGRILGSRLPLDVLTVAGGRTVDVPRPTSLGQVRALMRRGVSVVVRGSERHDPDLARLAESFERSLPGEVHVQLYATPAGTNSYGWHYDFEDVFIAQTAGIKDYYFRENTVARRTVLGEELDFEVFRQEQTQMFSSRLEPGDWLYVPARWWHLVKCVESSLSISVGVMSPEALRSAARLPAGWSGEPLQAGWSPS
jgi:50S ribosomal protein L16 3-hydroxylase